MKLLSLIKKDMEFNRNLTNIIQVLKEIAIAQYHVLERKIKAYDKIFNILDSFFEIDIEGLNHPLLKSENRTPCVVAVTSDTGLLGPLNMQVMALSIREVTENNSKLIIVGEKGKLYAQERGINFVAFEGVKDDIRYAQAVQLRDYIVKEVFANRIGVLKVIYPYAVSIMNQRIHSLELLPLAKQVKKRNPFAPTEIILESSLGDIAGYLACIILGQKLYEIFGLSRLAEMAARFVHLEQSKQKLEDVERELKLQYFRQRHELIDRNMRELYAARLAFK